MLLVPEKGLSGAAALGSLAADAALSGGGELNKLLLKNAYNDVVSQCKSTFRRDSTLTTTKVGGKNKMVKNVNTIRYLLRVLLFWASIMA